MLLYIWRYLPMKLIMIILISAVIILLCVCLFLAGCKAGKTLNTAEEVTPVMIEPAVIHKDFLEDAKGNPYQVHHYSNGDKIVVGEPVTLTKKRTEGEPTR